MSVAGQGRSNFIVRLAAAIVLAPLALAIAFADGPLWAILAVAVAIGLLAEWLSITNAFDIASFASGALVLVLAGACAAYGRPDVALAVVVASAAFRTFVLPRNGWSGGGVLYAGITLCAAIVLRDDVEQGFAAILFVLLIVWATDSGGYFVGRSVGGPKLAPTISPAKTWSGAAGGLGAALVVAGAFVATGGGPVLPLLLVAVVLSVASQAGDLFESGIKRRFGVKDSGRLIPGHGGLLDRLDGFVAAVTLAAIIGVARAGGDGAGRGLMVW